MFLGFLDGLFSPVYFYLGLYGGGEVWGWQEGMKEGVGRTHKDPPLSFRVLVFGAASHRYPEFHDRCRRDETIDHCVVPFGTF